MHAHRLNRKKRRSKRGYGGPPPHLASRRKILFEQLEPRLLLSGDPVLTLAAAAVVQISQQNAPAGDGGFIVNVNVNNNPTVTLGTAQTGIHGLTIQGAGNDTVNVVSNLSINLAVQGGSTNQVNISGGVINGNVQTGGGQLSISAQSIAVAPTSPSSSITLDTRNLDTSGHTAGDSGNITIDSQHTSISNAQLLTNVDTGSRFAAGSVEINADDSAIRQSSYFSPVFASSKDASIALEDSSINAGEVSISATAKDLNLYDDLGVYASQLVGNGFGLLGQVPGILTSLISGIAAQVDVRASAASIDLTGSHIDSSAAVDISAQSVANASFHTVAVSSALSVDGKTNPFTVAVGYGEATSAATATLTDSSVTADEGVTIDTGAVSEAEIKARASSNAVGVLGSQSNQVAIALAIGNTSENSQIVVDQVSSVTSKHGAVAINADGEVKNFDWAEPAIFGDGTAGIGIAVSVDTANISATVNGTIDAFGGSQVSFDSSGVDTSGNTITLPNLPFEENEAVVFHAPDNGPAVGGLTDGSTYYVHERRWRRDQPR
jgi:hypothetical protein